MKPGRGGHRPASVKAGMIAYLEGRLLYADQGGRGACVVLTAGGVGYEVHLPAPLLARLPAVGENVAFHVSTIVREDALDLYGFASADERETFNVLLSVSKLGPKTAMATLAVFSPEELRAAVAGEDPGALTRVPGIGKKSAQHIFLELKYKLGPSQAAPVPGAATLGGQASVFRDALTGLTNLGYDEDEARSALEQVFKTEPDLDVAAALRAALKNMAKNR